MRTSQIDSTPTVSSLHDFNAQLDAWLPIANARHSRSPRAKPSDLIVLDRARMRTLSPIASETMFRNTVRLPRDYYVRVFTNDYSVDPSMIGRLVDVSADLDTVTVSHDGLVIASRERVWARQLAITDPDHVIKAALLRKQFQILTSRWPRPTDSVETRDLAAS